MRLPKQQINACDGTNPNPKPKPKERKERRAETTKGKPWTEDRVSARLRSMILERDGMKCVLCGRMAKDGVVLHVDHIVPRAQGGKSVEENLATLCQDCNLGKGARKMDILKAIGHALK